jgi:hypothetical protein
VRASACRALPRVAERGDEVAHRALTRCLNDPEKTVCHVATGAVVHISLRPSQHFVTWAPDPTVKAAYSKSSGLHRGRPQQQRMYLESPMNLNKTPAQRRRTSASPGSLPVAKKQLTSGRAGQRKP